MENIKHNPVESNEEFIASQSSESPSLKDRLAALGDKARDRADRFFRGLGGSAAHEVELEEISVYETDGVDFAAHGSVAHELDGHFKVSRTYESMRMLAEGKLRAVYLSEYKKELIQNPFTAMLSQEENRIKRRGREAQIWDNEDETVIKNDVQAGISLQEITRSERNRYQDRMAETLISGIENEDPYVEAFLDGFLQSSGLERATVMYQIQDNQLLQEQFAKYTRYIGKNMIDRYNYMKKSHDTYLYGDIAASAMTDIINSGDNYEENAVGKFVSPEKLSQLKGENFTLDLSPPGLKDYEIDIPLNLFVSAEGFDSWEGRGNNGDALADGLPSRDKIGRFAKSDHDLVIRDITIYMEPSGKLFIKSNNAHRLAAAIKRGQSKIRFSGHAGVVLLDGPLQI